MQIGIAHGVVAAILEFKSLGVAGPVKNFKSMTWGDDGITLGMNDKNIILTRQAWTDIEMPRLIEARSLLGCQLLGDLSNSQAGTENRGGVGHQTQTWGTLGKGKDNRAAVAASEQSHQPVDRWVPGYVVRCTLEVAAASVQIGAGGKVTLTVPTPLVVKTEIGNSIGSQSMGQGDLFGGLSVGD